MKKTIQILASCLSLLCICLSTSSCWFWGGYNKIMYDHFLDENNYYTWTVTVKDFVWGYLDEDHKYNAYSMYENSENLEYRALEEKEYAYTSLPVAVLDAEEAWMDYIEEKAFDLCYENAVTLIENGFLENVKIGDTITIRATCWTYGDTDWFFLAELESGGVTYLDMQTGLKNIREYMDENRSLL